MARVFFGAARARRGERFGELSDMEKSSRHRSPIAASGDFPRGPGRTARVSPETARGIGGVSPGARIIPTK